VSERGVPRDQNLVCVKVTGARAGNDVGIVQLATSGASPL
jgi:hypothetical protein